MVVLLKSPRVAPAARRSASVFPLHTTPLERYMLLDDRPDYPMTFTMQVELQGRGDRRAMEGALETALQRHPMLSAVLRPVKRGRLCWVAAEAPPTIDWCDSGRPTAWDGSHPEYIDLKQEPGLRVFAHQGDGRTVLTFQFHHSATDGVGAHQFVGDLLAAYGVQTADGRAAPRLAPIDHARLRQRGRAQTDLADGPSFVRWIGRAVADALRLGDPLVRRLATSRRSSQASRPTPYPHIESFTFPRGVYAQLRDQASRAGATTNDLLLAELFATLASWNQAKGRSLTTDRVRIDMPVDMRQEEDAALPAASLACQTFLTRSAAACRDALALLPGVRDETSKIKRERLGARFGDLLAATERLPGALTAALRLGLVRCTAVLSNVGDPRRRFTAKFPEREGRLVCGDLTLLRVTGAPPIRADMPVSLWVLNYRGELTISANCDPRRFAPEEAREFLAAYVGRLRSRAGEGGAAEELPRAA